MVDLAIVLGFAALVLACAVFGFDSRDGRDWQPRRDR